MSTDAQTKDVEPDDLDADMTPRDIADVLRRLRFWGNSKALLKIDRAARDYVVAAILARCGSK
jgi:hypothetical protein